MRKLVNYNKGFTLIELIIAVVIIAALASIMSYRLLGTVRSSKINAAVNNVIQIEKAIQAFYVQHNNTWPTGPPGNNELEKMLDKSLDNLGVSYTKPLGNQVTVDVVVTCPTGTDNNDFNTKHKFKDTTPLSSTQVLYTISVQ